MLACCELLLGALFFMAATGKGINIIKEILSEKDKICKIVLNGVELCRDLR
jgi:hypothetical protein